MKNLAKLGMMVCCLMLTCLFSSFTNKPADDEPSLEGTWIETFYEFNFDAGKVESKTYNVNSWLTYQEKWIFTAKGDHEYNLKATHYHRTDGFTEDGDYDIKVVDNCYVTEFNDNFKIVELTADKLVIECYNDTTLKERKTFKRSVK